MKDDVVDERERPPGAILVEIDWGRGGREKESGAAHAVLADKSKRGGSCDRLERLR